MRESGQGGILILEASEITLAWGHRGGEPQKEVPITDSQSAGCLPLGGTAS